MQERLNAFLGYDDQYQRPDLYTSTTVTANGAGSAIATMPVANLLDPRPAKPWGRSGVPQGGVIQIDVQSVPNANAAEIPTAAAVVVVGAYAKRTGTSERHAVNIRCQVGNLAMTTVQYDATAIAGVAFGFSSGRNTLSQAFVFAGRGSTSTDATNRAEGGIRVTPGGSHQAVRVLLTVPAAITGTYEVYCERIMLVRGFYCATAQGFESDYIDLSDVMRSYDGTPYVSAKPVRTRIAAELIRIEQPQAFGGEDATFTEQRSNLHAVNRICGKSGTVVFLRNIAASPANGATLSLAAQSDVDCLVGLMDEPVAIRHETILDGPGRGLYRGRLSLTASA